MLGVAEVNAYLLMKFFGDFKGTQKLAFELIHNHWGAEVDNEEGEERRILRSTSHHELISAPKFSRWTDSGWKKYYKMEYQHHTCMTPGCTKRIRTVCTCNKRNMEM